MAKKETKITEKPKTTKKLAAKKVEAIEVVEETKPDVETKKAVKAPLKRSSGKKAVKKAAAIKKFQSHEGDTGSTEVQVAVLTEKITSLSKHLTTHKKDVDSRMGLLRMISQRRSLLGYLEKRNSERYKKLIGSLGLRK